MKSRSARRESVKGYHVAQIDALTKEKAERDATIEKVQTELADRPDRSHDRRGARLSKEASDSKEVAEEARVDLEIRPATCSPRRRRPPRSRRPATSRTSTRSRTAPRATRRASRSRSPATTPTARSSPPTTREDRVRQPRLGRQGLRRAQVRVCNVGRGGIRVAQGRDRDHAGARGPLHAGPHLRARADGGSRSRPATSIANPFFDARTGRRSSWPARCASTRRRSPRLAFVRWARSSSTSSTRASTCS